jgi:hydroxypyruvate reductase
MNVERLFTATLRHHPEGEKITRILAAALAAVEPEAAVCQHLQRQGEQMTVGDRTYNLEDYQRIFLVAAGKAGIPMSRAAARLLGNRLTAGIAIVKDKPPSQLPIPHCQILTGGHPLPTVDSIESTRQLAALLAGVTERDLVLILISGGASALMAQPTVSLPNLQQLTAALLACGANINEINTLRKHLDRVKGGGLARLAQPASTVTLILSDVVGNSLDAIASGPTVPDSTTFQDAWAVLERYDLLNKVPQSAVNYIQAGVGGKFPETPKAGNPLFEKVQNQLVGSNRQAAEAALKVAREEGFNALLLTTYAQGEARGVGRLLAAVAREIVETGQPISPPACLILGGETTVTLCKNPGKGGRNQELALAAVGEMAGLSGAILVALATDGGDGPTDAAGAVVTGETAARAKKQQLDFEAALKNNDAYPFFAALDDLLKPGATETNVNDLAFLFVMEED